MPIRLMPTPTICCFRRLYPLLNAGVDYRPSPSDRLLARNITGRPRAMITAI